MARLAVLTLAIITRAAALTPSLMLAKPTRAPSCSRRPPPLDPGGPPMHASAPPALAIRPARAAAGPRMLALSGVPASGLLAVTILLEVLATTSMKLAEKQPLFYLGVFGGYAACFTIFPLVLRVMPLGVAYAIWSGAGTALTSVVSAFLFKDLLTARKVVSIGLIIAGVVGLNLSGH
ncbi:hypothetical protein AB1Y20_006739 [Prymnesium parvum]|uniref:Uncharacterized protein n=1 Tax=Prymnesium parvum TaxID=97485 RepID=A0AB34IZA6_PRYPA